MLRLKQLKQQKDANPNKTIDVNATAKLRISQDISKLDIPKICKVEHPEPDNIMLLKLTVTPDENIYKDAVVPFIMNFSCNYPFEPPKIKCTKKIYHPNIDLDGNICLNILRDDWTPALDIQSIIIGIVFLFTHFNSDDPLNKDAAEMLAQNAAQFERNVRQALAGSRVDGVNYDRLYASDSHLGRGFGYGRY